MKVRCQTNLLPDIPAEADAFGSHESLATAIAELVASEKGGKAIALTGFWGSGKSTVVELLRTTLSTTAWENKIEAAVFVFDAWVHQGDPLRRSFLETLISFLVKQGWTDHKVWAKELEGISRRREEAITTSEPVLTGPGRIIATSALLVPIGLSLFSSYSNEKAIVIAGLPLWILGLLLSLGPLVVAFLMWVRLRPTWKVWERDFWMKHRSPHEEDSLISLFIEKKREINRLSTVRTPDPTSVEFQDIFQRIMANAFKKKTRILLIVMDNLDRVPPQEALTIWSTMRAFFGNVGHDELAWISRFWLLVPFDRAALDRLWGSKSDGNDEFVKAFTDKTFQVEFRVSPPVLSDWKKLLLDNLKIALPAHSSDEFYLIYLIFHHKGLPQDRAITPRDIKLFVNGLGSLHRQWGDRIPLHLQALYVLCAKDIKDPGQDLIRQDFLEERMLRLVEDLEWQKYLAALHFNVDPDKAIEVLLSPRVTTALAKGDATELKKVLSVQGFPTVLDHVIEDNCSIWAAKEPNSLALAALAIEGLDSHTLELGHIWRRLREAVRNVNRWNGFAEDAAKGVEIILRHSPREEVLKISEAAVKGITSGIRGPGEEPVSPDPETNRGWVIGAIYLTKILHDFEQKDVLRNHFRILGPPAAYLDVMGLLAEKEALGASAIQHFVPEAQPEQIIDELATILAHGNFQDRHAAVIGLMLEVDSQWPWNSLVDPLQQRLQASVNPSPAEVSGCIRALLWLASNPSDQQAGQAVQNLCRQGHITHQLQRVQNEPLAAAACLVSILSYLPDGKIQSAPGSANAGVQHYNNVLSNPSGHPNVINGLTDLLVEFRKVGDLISARANIPALQPLVTAVLTKLAESKQLPNHLSDATICDHFPVIDEALPDDILSQPVATIVQRGTLIPRLTGEEFSPEKASLYISVFNGCAQDNRPIFGDYIVNGLKSLSKEQWAAEFQEPGTLPYYSYFYC